MLEVLLALVLSIALIIYVIPTLNDLSKAIRDEADRVHKEGLIKTDGAFWSPDQEYIKPKH
ncbi:MAG: hypothetical protein Q4A96_00660 [Candidatus Saccharibacteria bacterium]|nr:hypothetical protein [Candidatus Saccharibacteria bacterium]